ncbi:hypothetical protein D1AOALGA4SA_2997 [Olavius algarvensis Delta 1 endosymbiont]|nr:hypothetical protein D1AOALGA4SA_2997 [Olavius algarvensis Delta 1 endosymbiont]
MLNIGCEYLVGDFFFHWMQNSGVNQTKLTAAIRKGKINTVMIKIILILIAIISFAPAALADEYTGLHKFDPIHIERNKLFLIASEIFQYVQKVNVEYGTSKGYIELGHDSDITKMSLPLAEDAFENFPRNSYSGKISIVTAEGLVSKLYFSFTDSFRIVTVSGKSREQVAALIKLVDEKFGPYEAYVGGKDFRIVLCIIGMFFYWIATLPIWFALKVRNEPLFIAITFFFLSALILVPPWSTIYPGFLASVEISSFLEGKTGLFTLIGLILALATPVVSLLYRSSKSS